jgi:pyruvate kinase
VNTIRINSLKRTKVVATMGPASSSQPIIKQMIQAGLNAARFNFSHGDHKSHAKIIAIIRELSDELACPIAIMGDLRGPRLRIGDLEGDKIELIEGQPFCLTPEACLGNAERVSISYPKLARDVSIGNKLLLDDGSIHLQVARLTGNNEIETTVIQGGRLSSRRGINVPGVHLSIPPLTQKDLEDIDFAISQDVDYLALSFVQSANDIQTLKTLLAAKNSDIGVIAKIEMSGGLADIEAIVAESDAVMVARGDMALEMSFSEVPIAQKHIIATCRKNAVPVITATQMLESMISASKPTRAEASDIANAVFDGTDALMLSAETAIGKYPVETIATMTRIAQRAEQAWRSGEVPKLPQLDPAASVESIISHSSSMAAHHLHAAVIITYTRSGSTARHISRFRPDAPVLVLTPNARIYRQIALSWGVTPMLIENLDNTDLMTQAALDYAQKAEFARPGDYVVITSGNPAGPPGNTNLLRIEQI